jgi:hypothetical protein
MSRERIRIELERYNDEWRTRVTQTQPHDSELVDMQHVGSGPADALEQLGQELDTREVERIKRERGI